jgi:hypothetical protein
MVARIPELPADPLPPFTRRQLDDAGLSPHQLDALLGRGLVVQPVRGAYLDARLADDSVARARAAALVLPPGVVAARRLAAWVYGVDARGPGEQHRPVPMDFVSDRQVRHPGLLTRQAALPESDVTVLHGLPLTTVERTACDVARYLPPFMGLAVLDALARDGRIQPAVLLDRIEAWRGERFVARARRLIELCEPETESFGESWLRLRLVDAGFPRPRPQIWVYDSNGVGLYRIDMGWEEQRVGAEYDGEEFHSDPEHLEHDARRRDKLAREHGWQVVGVGKGEVLGPRLDLELAVGELLGLEPQIRRRLW